MTWVCFKYGYYYHIHTMRGKTWPAYIYTYMIWVPILPNNLIFAASKNSPLVIFKNATCEFIVCRQYCANTFAAMTMKRLLSLKRMASLMQQTKAHIHCSNCFPYWPFTMLATSGSTFSEPELAWPMKALLKPVVSVCESQWAAAASWYYLPLPGHSKLKYLPMPIHL